MKKIVLLLVILVSFFALEDLAKAKTKKRLIVTSTTQTADFARQIVGDRFLVKSVLAPGADPHTYQPTPGDAKLVRQADLTIENGLYLEGKNWMRTLAADAGKTIITATRGIKPLKMDYDGKMISDPHAWFSPQNAAVYINNITQVLIKFDPQGKKRFQARAKLYLQQLRVLDAWIRGQFSLVPPQQRILVTSHDAFNYFAAEYGWQNKAPVGWSTGSEVGGGMTPKRRKVVVDSIKKFAVKAIFVETSINPKLIREIARAAAVKVGGELYSDSMGVAGSAGETYLGMMRENVLTITNALR